MPDEPVETGASPVSTPEAAPSGPLSKAEAMKGLETLAPPEEPTVEETPPAEEVVGTPEKPAETPPAEPAEPATTEGTEGPEEPGEKAKGFTVELPAGHPASQGVGTITVQTEEEERALRALANSAYVRRPQLEAEVQRRQAVEGQNQDLVAQNRDLRERVARLESTESARGKWEQTPEFRQRKETYESLKAAEEQGAVAEGTAEQFRNSVLERGYQDLADSEYADRQKTIEEEDRARIARENEEAGRIFMHDAWQRAQERYPMVRSLQSFSQDFLTARDEFEDKLRRGHHRDILGQPEKLQEQFAKHFRRVLSDNPEVRKVFEDLKGRERAKQDAAAKAAAEEKRERERIAQEAVDKHKQDAASRREAVPLNPVARIPSAPRGRGPDEGPRGTDTDSAPLSPQQIKRQQRQGAIEDAGRYSHAR